MLYVLLFSLQKNQWSSESACKRQKHTAAGRITQEECSTLTLRHGGCPAWANHPATTESGSTSARESVRWHSVGARGSHPPPGAPPRPTTRPIQWARAQARQPFPPAAHPRAKHPAEEVRQEEQQQLPLPPGRDRAKHPPPGPGPAGRPPVAEQAPQATRCHSACARRTCPRHARRSKRHRGRGGT